MTEYLRAGFGKSRSGEGRLEAGASEGVACTPAQKDMGSRQNCWELCRERLKNVTKPAGLRLFVFSNRRQFIRTVPALSRDRVNMDNVDSLAEVAVAMISDLLVLK